VADLTVIGGGPGGYVAAIRAAQLGCNVRLIEREKVGGTCLNRGCIPTKVLLHAVELKGNFDRARDYGFSVKESTFDWKVLMDRKDATVKQLTDGVATLLESWGVDVIYGEASFVNSKEIVVKNGNGTSKLRSDSFIIATGSKPSMPPIEGLQCRNVLTSDDVLQIQEIPSSMLIVGGGVIGIEFATLFFRPRLPRHGGRVFAEDIVKHRRGDGLLRARDFIIKGDNHSRSCQGNEDRRKGKFPCRLGSKNERRKYNRGGRTFAHGRRSRSKHASFKFNERRSRDGAWPN